MFTGLVEFLGQISNREILGTSGKIEIKTTLAQEYLRLGESIAINGVCLTLTKVQKQSNILHFDVLSETFRKSNLGILKINSTVNLECSLLPTDRMGGHIVQGHIDGTGKITKIEKIDKDYIYHIKYPHDLQSFFVKKGSICLDGISLTIADITSDILTVHIIPTTYKNTAISSRNIGENLNIETDIVGKYLNRFFDLQHTKSPQNISIDMLKNSGWL